MPRVLVHFLLLAAACALPARADVFYLAGGGEVDGELVNVKEEPRKNYVVKTAWGKITLPSDRVARVDVTSQVEKDYQKWLAAMPKSALGNWQMAEWCRERRLNEYRAKHLRRVLEYEPDHEQARHGLGYTRVDGKWVITAEYMRSRGLVRYGNSWRTPAEVKIEEQKAALKDEIGQWHKKVRRWRGQLGRKNGNEALAALNAIDDWKAGDAVASALDDETNRDVKRLYIEILGRIGGSTATTALVERALEDADDRVRSTALSQLKQGDAKAAVNTFLRAIQDKDNTRVNLGGIALGTMGDQDAVLPLIDALTTKHRVLLSSGSNSGLGPITTSFGSGGSGLSAGKKPKYADVDVPNQGVLNALIALTGVSHDFNKEAWRRWYEAEHTPRGVDLRRRDD